MRPVDAPFRLLPCRYLRSTVLRAIPRTDQVAKLPAITPSMNRRSPDGISFIEKWASKSTAITPSARCQAARVNQHSQVAAQSSGKIRQRNHRYASTGTRRARCRKAYRHCTRSVSYRKAGWSCGRGEGVSSGRERRCCLFFRPSPIRDAAVFRRRGKLRCHRHNPSRPPALAVRTESGRMTAPKEGSVRRFIRGFRR
jgi:hypothetical protein